MPLSHVQRQEQRRQAQRAEASSAAVEDEPNAFETSYAPLPPQVQPTVTEVLPTPPIVYAPSPPSVASQPTPYVRILHQTASYQAGAIVAAAVFDDVDRLIRLGAVAYDRDATGPTPIDQDMATVRKLAQPVSSNMAIPRAPWVQATIVDILGPATYRAYVPRAPVGYSIVPAEHGQTLMIADPTPKTPVYSEPTTLAQLDAGSEAILADPELNKGKQ